ncbi:MAG: 30S ribosomal protein S3 [Candidatus Lindowbacteria bacterium RIFCSPLOWO2_12_FULL_62_27]|nr:ribosomal protein S3 [uncultured bacterium]OGH59715.1 MAG: 30S ribosomal protein S3 [Candidatus Lindowbacteria bacterium RIFCSPLOWO2_12_FULL_62_27]
MGQKVNPIAFRLGINRNWDARWYARKDFAKKLAGDLKIRKFIKSRLYHAGIASILIERFTKRVRVTIEAARAGLVIGKKGSNIDKLAGDIVQLTGLPKEDVEVNIEEVKVPDLCAILVAEEIARKIERRVAFRRAMKQAVYNSRARGGVGVKVMCSGRLAGTEIARREWYIEGRLPLQTIRTQIDFGTAEAKTKYGIIGVKVWICKGETPR